MTVGLILVALMLAQAESPQLNIVTRIEIIGYAPGMRARGEPWVTISNRPSGCGFAAAQLDLDDAALERRAHAWRGQTINVEVTRDAPYSCIVRAQSALTRAGVKRIGLVPALDVVKVHIPAGACRLQVGGRDFRVDQPGPSPRDWSAVQVSISGASAAHSDCFGRVIRVLSDWGMTHLGSLGD
jgi:hypothetical protein